MLLASFGGFWDYWQLYHKVTFDGPNRLIYINEGEFDISVKTDIYSDWKEWMLLEDYSKYLPAFRVTGGDPLGLGAYSGDIYFLINNWQIVIDHGCTIDGVIYSDNFPSPFITPDDVQLVTNKVSSLVQTIAPQIEGLTVPTVQEIRVEMDDNSTKLLSINTKVQTIPNDVWSATPRTLTDATVVVNQMDSNSIKLAQIKAILDTMPSAADTATEVWTAPVSTMTDKTTIGGYIHRLLLTIPKFLGLK